MRRVPEGDFIDGGQDFRAGLRLDRRWRDIVSIGSTEKNEIFRCGPPCIAKVARKTRLSFIRLKLAVAPHDQDQTFSEGGVPDSQGQDRNQNSSVSPVPFPGGVRGACAEPVPRLPWGR